MELWMERIHLFVPLKGFGFSSKGSYILDLDCELGTEDECQVGGVESIKIIPEPSCYRIGQ